MSDLILPFMVRNGDSHHVTEPDVSVPPALVITDQAGNIWTLGFNFAGVHGGEFAYNVLRNGIDTGQVANRIERKHGQIRIFTPAGWKNLIVSAVEPTYVFGIGARVTTNPGESLAVRVTVWRPAQPDRALVSFVFDLLRGGGLFDMRTAPIVCQPGEWLAARVEPSRLAAGVEVTALVAEHAVRAIPIVTVKELNHA